jgi:hypothetical protein
MNITVIAGDEQIPAAPGMIIKSSLGAYMIVDAAAYEDDDAAAYEDDDDSSRGCLRVAPKTLLALNLSTKQLTVWNSPSGSSQLVPAHSVIGYAEELKVRPR